EFPASLRVPLRTTRVRAMDSHVQKIAPPVSAPIRGFAFPSRRADGSTTPAPQLPRGYGPTRFTFGNTMFTFAKSTPRSLRTALGVEVLDARHVPAIFFNAATGVLDIEGTSMNDTATIDPASTPFGDDTIDVRLVTRDGSGTVLADDFRWFYANDV